MITLYNYQKKAESQILEAFSKGVKKIIIFVTG
jgi:hypothetical protein